MEIDIDEIKEKYQDISWSLEFAGEPPVRVLVGQKESQGRKLYKAFVVPPHNFYTLKGRPWGQTAAEEIARIIHEGEQNEEPKEPSKAV